MKNTLIKLGLVLKKEIVFTAALLLAVLSSFFVPVSKEYLGYLDYRVLALLFCLMFLVAFLLIACGIACLRNRR